MLGELVHNRRTTLRGATGALLAVVGLSGITGARSENENSLQNRGRGQGRCDVSVPDDYDSIQDAVDAAEPGDAVCVEAGTYEGTVRIEKDGLTLRSTDPREATIDARGKPQGVRIEADGVALEGFEIAGDDGTTSGVSILTSDGATERIRIVDNYIHGMARPGGGGVFELSSWGILAWGDQPLSGVFVEDNRIESIGGSPDGLPTGVGIDLHEVEGTRAREGAVVRRNTITDIADATVGVPKPLVDGEIEIDLPGVGVSIQPTQGELSDAGDPATDVRRNEITETWIDVVVGEAELTRVAGNEGSTPSQSE